VYYYFR